ncbi:MAG: rhomboid family intramembrane serine protease [Candidatus Melainabacteria bacterium]|nr:rhomboid family intramembrane serine protease [Candidatus Melainabacteria bacterium]
MFPLKDNLRCLTFPMVTVILVALNCVAFVLEAHMINTSGPAAFFMNWTLVPSQFLNAFSSGDPAALAHAVKTLFAAMFLHGGTMHLVGNMVFLFVFGRAMEARLGRFHFLVFYLLSGVVASLVHIASDPASSTPMLGASGAISGVLGGYLLLWPKAKITSYVPPIFIVQIWAWWFLAAWLILQVLPVMEASGGSGGGVAYWAHIGGYVAGFIWAGAVKLVKPVTDVCYIPVPDCDTDSKKNVEEKDS